MEEEKQQSTKIFYSLMAVIGIGYFWIGKWKIVFESWIPYIAQWSVPEWIQIRSTDFKYLSLIPGKLEDLDGRSRSHLGEDWRRHSANSKNHRIFYLSTLIVWKGTYPLIT